MRPFGMADVSNPKIVSREQWLAARKEHLAQEKQFTRARDELSRARRQMPWLEVDKQYVFDTPDGKQSLADLFGDRSQLIVYHFMFGPDWEDGCKSCSFWADNYNGIAVHLAHRDAAMVTISKAPLPKLQAFAKRMGWDFRWVSSQGNDFNRDFHVSFTPEEVAFGKLDYNYSKTSFPSTEAPGISVFYKDADGRVFHTYSCYSRGLDMLNGAYHYMDLLPKGRDEENLDYGMAWLRLKDQYED